MTRAVLAFAALATTAAAQQADSARLNPVVVTAERGSASISSSTAAVTRITADEIARTPHATLADLLRFAPGFTRIAFDGLGLDPQIMVRGFYGGGEAEYVVVLVDGRAVNHVHTGTVAWDVLPPIASIRSIEIVRGGSSAAWGDAAVGGVINVITRGGTSAAIPTWSASGGSFGSTSVGADARFAVGARDITLAGGYDRASGFRDHSERAGGRVNASATLLQGDVSNVSLVAGGNWRDFDEPGALLASIRAANRDASDTIFRFDHTKEHTFNAGLTGEREFSADRKLTGSISSEFRSGNAFRTLALAPGFGDTKEREFDNTRISAAAQWQVIGARAQLVLGAEAARATLDSKYYQVVTGDRTDYAAATGDRGALDTSAEAERMTGALFAQYALTPSDALRITVGLRYDYLDDSFTPVTPSGADASTDHSAFSPKLGVNVRVTDSPNHPTNVYASFGRSFKAPTLDQLYDVRNIPVPFPPFAIRTSNPDLEPQFGTNIELGVYHTHTVNSSLAAAVNVSIYQMQMKDELDFDVNTFQYVNIGRSRHRGVEVGTRLIGPRDATAFANYTFQSAEIRTGANSGNQLKAIPRHHMNAGASATHLGHLTTTFMVNYTRAAWLDDENTQKIPEFATVDVRFGYPIRGMQLFVDARNAFDRKYDASGFLDPSGSGEAYYYPAVGRVISVGVRAGW
ncbi:MAG TPA: TonB-dependent receptor [Gemmatimonadaceae bacterium]|nr:TonB-dependent receptor [Gemmatimonadaceae bacterium]